MRRLVLGNLVILASATAACACGTGRWTVKTGTDADARSVVTVAQAARIGDLVALPAPADPNAQPVSRFAPVEMKVFAVSAILIVTERERDEDYHLVIADPDDPGMTMIVEAPNPPCAEGSVFAGDILAVRQAIEGKFGPITTRQRRDIPVTVTGIAFFDTLHGQEGVAPNGIELHPLLSIQFN